MAAVAQNCHNLTNLGLRCRYSDELFDSVERLCAVNSHTLQNLSLWSCNYDEEQLVRLLAVCTNLQVLSCDMLICDLAVLVQAVFTCCPSISSFRVANMQIDIVKDCDGQKMVDIDVQLIESSSQDQIPLFSVIPFPVRKCSLGFETGVEVAALGGLAERFGPTVESLSLFFYPDVQPNVVVHLLGQFSNLRDLAFTIGHKDLITEFLVPVIPSTYRMLCELRLGYGCRHKATVSGLSALLDCFRALPMNVISTLDLSKRITVLKADLYSIAEVFPHLFSFTAMSTNLHVRQHTLLEIIVSGALKAKRIRCSLPSMWLSAELQEQGVHHKVVKDEFWLPL